MLWTLRVHIYACTCVKKLSKIDLYGVSKEKLTAEPQGPPSESWTNALIPDSKSAEPVNSILYTNHYYIGKWMCSSWQNMEKFSETQKNMQKNKKDRNSWHHRTQWKPDIIVVINEPASLSASVHPRQNSFETVVRLRFPNGHGPETSIGNKSSRECTHHRWICLFGALDIRPPVFSVCI